MPATTVGKMTVTEFLEWSGLPENADRAFELDRGEVIEMSRPGPMHARVLSLVDRALNNYLDSGKPGDVLADGGLWISDNTLLGPDVMFFTRPLSREELLARSCEVVPALCVEILSPSNRPGEMTSKTEHYFGRGVRLVWVLDPEEQTVRIVRPDELEKLLDDTDTLTGNGILPDFSCPVADLFRRPRPA